MKKVNSSLFLLILLLQAGIVKSQYLPFYENKNSSNALKMMNLNGKVKSIEQKSYKAIEDCGKYQKGERAVMSDQGSVNSDFSMQFDDKSRAIKEVFYNVWSVKELLISHRYDDKKNIEYIEQSEQAGRVSVKYTYSFNATGKLIAQYITQIFSNNSTDENKFMFVYDEKTFQLEKKIFNISQNDNYKSRIVEKYNSTWHLLSQEVYNEKNVLWMKEDFNLDKDNTILRHNYYALDCKTIDHYFNLKYDDKKNVIEKEYFLQNKLNKTYTYQYEYDTNGNWIKRVDFENAKPTFVLERTITYY